MRRRRGRSAEWPDARLSEPRLARRSAAAAERGAMTQASSVAASGAMPGEVGNTRRIVGRALVDHGQPRVDGRAVLGIDRAVDGGREHDAAALLQPDEGVGPGGIVRREARPGDRDEATAIGEARQRRARCGEARRRPCGDRHGPRPRRAGSSARRSARRRRRDDRRYARRRSG